MTDLIGKNIGQYQIVELIHEGENTVYKGFQPSMNRYVAVKVLNSSLAADPDFLEKFQRDMERIAGLEHPNILPIYDYGQQGGVYYIVSRYVETGTLKDRLPPAFSPPQASAMLNPIAGALDYIYRSGVWHGNLKPSNVLIDPQGQPLLSDLGYVQGIDAGGKENVYLSPEQIQGAGPDIRSDVYALGVLLYHMLVGEPPAPGAAVSVRARRPDLPEAVDQTILKATAQSPDQRYQNPGQLADAFSLALRPEPVPAAQAAPAAAPQAPPPAPPAKSGGGGTPWWIIVLVVLVAGCCVLGGLGVLVGGNLGQGSAPAAEAEQPAAQPTPTPDGSLVQGLFDMVGGIFDSLASMMNSIFGGGTPPAEPSGGSPEGEQPPPEAPAEQPPPEGEQPPPEAPAE